MGRLKSVKPLAEYILRQKITGESDLEIIYLWFVDNDLEADGIELLAGLSKSKIEKLDAVLNNARVWIPNNPNPTDKDGNRYPELIERNLIRIIQYFQLQMDLPDTILEWAKEKIPTIYEPSIFFRPAQDWLEAKYGIKFKGVKNDA